MPRTTPLRWTVQIVTDDNKVIVQQIEEIVDLDEIVEQGPPWNALKHIIITYNLKDPQSRS